MLARLANQHSCTDQPFLDGQGEVLSFCYYFSCSVPPLLPTVQEGPGGGGSLRLGLGVPSLFTPWGARMPTRAPLLESPAPRLASPPPYRAPAPGRQDSGLWLLQTEAFLPDRRPNFPAVSGPTPCPPWPVSREPGEWSQRAAENPFLPFSRQGLGWVGVPPRGIPSLLWGPEAAPWEGRACTPRKSMPGVAACLSPQRLAWGREVAALQSAGAARKWPVEGLTPLAV